MLVVLVHYLKEMLFVGDNNRVFCTPPPTYGVDDIYDFLLGQGV